LLVGSLAGASSTAKSTWHRKLCWRPQHDDDDYYDDDDGGGGDMMIEAVTCYNASCEMTDENFKRYI